MKFRHYNKFSITYIIAFVHAKSYNQIIMGLESKAVLATTVYAQSELRYQRVIADLTLRTLAEARGHNHAIVVVDGGSPIDYIHQMTELGALVLPQETPGMGRARRQALKTADDIADERAIVWLEPEKYPMVPLLDEAVDYVNSRNFDMVMFRRKSLESYPPEQMHSYQMGNLAIRYIAGIETDFFFGPVTLSHQGVDYFLRYQSPFDDLWDSIHVPKLQIINDGLPWTQVEVDYTHPREQTEAETGVLDLFLRRTQQMYQLTQALLLESQRSKTPSVDPIPLPIQA